MSRDVTPPTSDLALRASIFACQILAKYHLSPPSAGTRDCLALRASIFACQISPLTTVSWDPGLSCSASEHLRFRSLTTAALTDPLQSTHRPLTEHSKSSLAASQSTQRADSRPIDPSRLTSHARHVSLTTASLSEHSIAKFGRLNG